MSKRERRFEIVEREASLTIPETYVLKDNRTGVLYIYHNSGRGAGLTPLIDKDGKPFIEEI